MKPFTNKNLQSAHHQQSSHQTQAQKHPFIEPLNLPQNSFSCQIFSQRQTPPLLQHKIAPKQENMRGMKGFNFGKCLDFPQKKYKKHKKQRSADVVYMDSKTETIYKSQYCGSSVSQAFKKQKAKKKHEQSNKAKKHKKKKSIEFCWEKFTKEKLNKKSYFLKKKSKPTYDIFRSSKLVSLKSVECSLFDSTKEQDSVFYEGSYTENIFSHIEQEPFPFCSEEIKQYEKLYKKEQQEETVDIEGEFQFGDTEHLIKKYIGKTSQTQRQQMQQVQEHVNLSQKPEKKGVENLLIKIEDMLSQIKKRSQDISSSSSKDSIVEKCLSPTQLKTVNVFRFDQLLSDRMKSLNNRRINQLNKLEDKLEEGELKEYDFLEERKKINKWTNYQLQNTEKVKNIIRSGVKYALNILSKSEYEVQQSPKKKNLKGDKPLSKSSSLLKYVPPPQTQSRQLKPDAVLQPITVEPKFFNLKKIQQHEPVVSYSRQLVENVFQYIFIDLCLELLEEDTDNTQRIKKRLITGKKYESRRKGLDCGKKNVLSFVKNFIKFVQNDEELRKNMLMALTRPIGPSPLEMLKYMREEVEEFDDFQEIQKSNEEVSYVFHFAWFEKFSQMTIERYEFDLYFDDPEKEEKRINFLRHALHFHNKAVFDCINESIDKYRPFGLFGIPFPWKKKSNLVHDYSPSYVQNILKKMAEDVHQACLYLCGVLFDKEKSQFSHYQLTQRQIQELREDRMSRLLCADLNQNEPRWLFFDDQQTEIIVDVSNFVFRRVVGECLNEFLELMTK